MDRVDGHEQHELRQILAQTQPDASPGAAVLHDVIAAPFVGH